MKDKQSVEILIQDSLNKGWIEPVLHDGQVYYKTTKSGKRALRIAYLKRIAIAAVIVAALTGLLLQLV